MRADNSEQAARQDQAFGEAAQLVSRREREQIQPFIGRGADRAREQERLGANVGIDKA
jgi:hypothetical protein